MKSDDTLDINRRLNKHTLEKPGYMVKNRKERSTYLYTESLFKKYTNLYVY